MKNEEVSKKIEEFLSFLRECETLCHMAESDEQEANYATQDILHSLELEEHDYRDFAKISKELKTVRKKRREAKDTIAVMSCVVKWAEDNKNTIKSLERLLGDTRKVIKSWDTRIYIPRTKRG